MPQPVCLITACASTCLSSSYVCYFSHLRSNINVFFAVFTSGLRWFQKFGNATEKRKSQVNTFCKVCKQWCHTGMLNHFTTNPSPHHTHACQTPSTLCFFHLTALPDEAIVNTTCTCTYTRAYTRIHIPTSEQYHWNASAVMFVAWLLIIYMTSPHVVMLMARHTVYPPQRHTVVVIYRHALASFSRYYI